ncbi:protein FAM149A [Alosa alosa]|uniref:protein FAM149A n=1 Tax=Alosa alosa TaxID=278164 RepID=UPI00201524F5|nr:protein FAM149A [Alosa alosa]
MTSAQGDPRRAPSASLPPSLPAPRLSRFYRAPGDHRDSPLVVIGRRLLQDGDCRAAAGSSPVHHIKSGSRAKASRFSPSCATGLSTEHSSIYSWRYDLRGCLQEFDRVNTQRVHQLFCALDELLYEGKVSGRSQGLQDECQAWNGHSPHLRILGNQLEPPKQEGFQYIHTQTPSARSTVIHPCPDRREDPSQLYVEGHSLASGAPSAAQSASDPRPHLSGHPLCPLEKEGEEGEEEEEVVYEAEGKLEEFLAYDGKEMEDEGDDQRKQKKACYHAAALGGEGGGGGGGGGVPPVSPHACIKDAVAGEVFDDAWRLATHALQGLLCKHWEMDPTGQSPAGAGGGVVMIPGVVESDDRGQNELSSQVNTKCHRRASSRASNAKMFLACGFSSAQDSSDFRINLNGVMTIQAKPLQQRPQGSSEKSPRDSDDRSSALVCGRSEAQRSLCAFSHRAPGQRRLLPRLSGSRARTLSSSQPLHSNQALHGTKLCPVSEGLPSPPVSAVLNRRPLHLASDAPEQDTSGTRPPRYAQPRWRLLRGGMSSAVHPRSSLPPLREPTLARPSTTHTTWSDRPMKSSFSPVDFACSVMKPPGHVALKGFPGDRYRMDVTGFSLGVASSMTSSFSESATPPRRRRAYMPLSAEGEEDNRAHVMGAACQRKALGRFPGNGRRKCQVVMP